MRRLLQAAGFIARRDLVFMLRQRETLLWTFVMPIVFFYFIGTVTGGFGSGGDPAQPDNLALQAPANPGFLVPELIERLQAQNYNVVQTQTDEELQRYARRLTVPEPAAGYASFTEAVLAGEPMTLKLGRSGDGAGVQFDQIRVARAVYGLLADLVVAGIDDSETGAPNPSPGIRRAEIDRIEAMPRSITLSVRPAGKRHEPPSGYEQTIPGTTVMFTLLVGLTSGSILLVIERERGLLRRLAATPISRGAVVLGKLGGRVALGVVQIGFGMLTGTVVFGMRWGDSIAMVVVLLAAWALFAASLGVLLGNLARSEPQMAGLGVVSTMSLAALGGCWWPIEITPDWMQSLAMALPTGWAMDAMHKLVSFGYGPASVLPHIAALLVSSLIIGWLAARTFRYQ